MKLSCEINFWSDDVGCFCHEAVARALHKTFENIEIDQTDYAHKKQMSVQEHFGSSNNQTDSKIIQSSWLEFLRNGPAYKFKLPSGTTGYFKRYRIEFDVDDSAPAEEKNKIEVFLKSLKLGNIAIKTED